MTENNERYPAHMQLILNKNLQVKYNIGTAGYYELLEKEFNQLLTKNERYKAALAHVMSSLNAMMTCFGMDVETDVEKIVMKGAEEAWNYGKQALKGEAGVE